MALVRDEIEALNWYYSMELAPGAFTKGGGFTNVLATQAVLERVDFEGTEALDIGTMEGRFSTLMTRAGATVTAYDRLNFTDRIKLVQEAFGVDFDYRPGRPFGAFATTIDKQFDFILMSGVLYHVIEPMLFLHWTRNLIRRNGAMVLETAAVLEEEASLYFNDRGRYGPATNYFQPTTGWLDYVLRIMGFVILDAEYVVTHKPLAKGKTVVRVSLLTQFLGEPAIEKSDTWAPKRLMEAELNELCPRAQHAPTTRRDWLHPKPIAPDFFYDEIDRKTLCLTRLLEDQAPIPTKDRPIVLSLGDTLT
ncbi:MAG: methyltransferase domain-containing protein [Devosia sp.]